MRAKRQRFPSCRFTVVMRRLLAINLVVALLGPWIAAVSGIAAPVVPCPMHRAGEGTNHDHAAPMAGAHRDGPKHHGGSQHGTTARGCNCAGECGRSGSAFSLPAEALARVRPNPIADAVIAKERIDFASATDLLPLATGPPPRLQI